MKTPGSVERRAIQKFSFSGCRWSGLFGGFGPFFFSFVIAFAAAALLDFVALSSHISFALLWRG
jgi:hypothetical protein